ncbi:MAG: hypothetical protein KBC41_03045 [Candidatus Pacebacteria bacterium]|nr:hypothetical protein [Candidatus Paceibacterota bacterium]MBP9867028.1 hypothetical protein [Candidatus Paceibacterota bacterium]
MIVNSSNETRCYKVRNQLALSRKEFALLLGVSRKSVENWEIIKTKPAPKHTDIIFQFLERCQKPCVFILLSILFSKESIKPEELNQAISLTNKLLTKDEEVELVTAEILQTQ